MGLLPATLRLLTDLHRTAGLEGPVVTLGNQDVYADLPTLRALFRETGCPWREPTEVAGHTSDLFDLVLKDRTRDFVHARTLFSMLGIDEYDDIDAFAYDSPSITQDLNEPVPAQLRGRFRLTIDGGTIEHVFDVRRCFENMVAMTKVGGRIVHWNSASNMVDHGLWAINPGAYFDYYGVNGFDQMSARIFEWDTQDPWRPCPSFEYRYGMPINGLCDPARATMVWFTARKLEAVPPRVPTQGLYTPQGAVLSGGVRVPDGTPSPPRRLL